MKAHQDSADPCGCSAAHQDLEASAVDHVDSLPRFELAPPSDIDLSSAAIGLPPPTRKSKGVMWDRHWPTRFFLGGSEEPENRAGYPKSSTLARNKMHHEAESHTTKKSLLSRLTRRAGGPDRLISTLTEAAAAAPTIRSISELQKLTASGWTVGQTRVKLAVEE